MMRKRDFSEILACPNCKGNLEQSDFFRCVACDLQFPVVDSLPVFINESNSLFRVKDFLEKRDTTYKTSSSRWKLFLKRILPSINLNLKARQNFQRFLRQVLEHKENPRILVVGGAVEGEGFDVTKLPKNITLIETDVAFGERTGIICDAHDLPFRNSTFDGVVVQAVLEHVLDPFRCVAEIHRVLKSDGIVYAESPFMAQVHAGRFDFLRFSHLGHRRLFRNFSEIESGATCGAGMALAWSYCYFLQNFFTNRTLQQIAFSFGRLTSFWLKYFDYFLIDKPASFDAALSYYFLGKKSNETLDDRELIKDYRGSFQ